MIFINVVLLLGILEGRRAVLPPGGALVPFYFPGGALPFKKNYKICFCFLNFFIGNS
jgi:hypothetical protein